MKNKLKKIKYAFLSLFLFGMSSFSFAQLPEFVWAKQVGSANPEGDFGQSIAVDKEGYVYTAGLFRDTVIVSIGNNTETLISKGSDDIFLTKQDSDGAFIWAKSFGSIGRDGVQAIAVSAKGEVYITGNFYGTADFDPSSNKVERTAAPNARGNAGTDFYISKFSSSGNFIWVKTGGNTAQEDGKGIAFDQHSDDIYFTGNMGSGNLNLDFGQGVFTLNNRGNAASFILRMKVDGSIKWGKVLGDLTASSVTSNAITVDLEGNIYTTGTFSNTADFNPDVTVSFPLTSVGKGDAFVSKLDSLGNFIWAKSMGGDEYEYGTSIAVDKQQNVYFTGSFQTTANFDPNGSFFLYTFGGSDIFVSKLDKDGNLKWAKNMGSSTDDVGRGIALDQFGNVYTTGSFQSPRAEFNPGLKPEDTFNLVSYGGFDAFIQKLDNDGNFIYAINMGGIAPDGAYGIALDNGYIYTTGGFARTSNFDPAGPNLNQMTAPGTGSDAFILKLLDCSSVADTTVVINGPDSICIGETYVYSIEKMSGALTYKWVVPQGWEGQSDQDSITVIAKGPGTISVIIRGVCDSIVVNLNVDLIMTPVKITVEDMQLSTTNSNEYNSWQWFLEGEKINGATDSVYIVKENGIYSVVVTGKEGCTDTAYYTVTNATSIKSKDIGASIKIYPNPASDQVFIDAPMAVSVTLTSIDGRILKNASFDQSSKSLNVGQISPGFYLILIKNMEGAQLRIEKLIIAK